jgi:ketosteroid isomerase-like protein
MNDRHEQNRAVAQRYVELYNADPERFVHECYHPDYKATAMGSGSFEGVDTFIEVERSVLRAAPRRRMEGVTMHVTDSVVVVEATVVDPDRGPEWSIPFCAVLEIRDDKIAADRTYADFTDWPGLNDAM